MSGKSFIIIAIISIVTSYVADFMDAIIRNALIGGTTGFPFRDSISTGYSGSVNGYMFALNIAFWFIVIFVAWKLFQKLFKSNFKTSKK